MVSPTVWIKAAYSLQGWMFCKYAAGSVTVEIKKHMALWEKHIDAYKPADVKVAEVGWEKFLDTWNEQALALVRTVVVYHGFAPASTDEQLRAVEQGLDLQIQREVAKGLGLDYPGRGENERKRIDVFLHQARSCILEEHKKSPIRDYNDEMIASDGARRPPCSREDIERTEKRLGVSLPKSYKDFLQTSDGWLLMNTYLLPASKIDWYRNSEWMEWFAPHNEFFPDHVSDKDYFNYGERQHPVKHMRKEHIPSLLHLSETISDVRDLQFLNPKVIFENGEWEAATKCRGGFVRFRSFAEMMENLYLRDVGYKKYYIANLMRRRLK